MRYAFWKFIAVLFPFIVLMVPSVVLAQAPEDQNQRLFILLKENDDVTLTVVKDIVEAQGKVVHIFPYQALIADVSTETYQQLADLPTVHRIYSQTVRLSDVAPAVQPYLSAWNALLVPPEIQITQDQTKTHFVSTGSPLTDTRRVPPEVVGNQLSTMSVTPSFWQTSEYMTGSVAVGIVLLESDGSVDPSTENWTSAEKQKVFDEIVVGLDWWASQESRANLSFVYDDHWSVPLSTGIEPISRPSIDEGIWVTDAMIALGHEGSNYFERIFTYNNWLRTHYQTDWAFTIFVVDSTNDDDDCFSDGYFAYAYLGGPFMVMTYGNNGFGPENMDNVAAHETGHIFLALDQYYSAQTPCDRRSGYLDIENQNSEYGDCLSDVPSVMRGGIVWAIDPYGGGQLGWRDTDEDDILDPLDTALPLSITSLSQNDATVVVQGSATIEPFPSPSRLSVTINKLIEVQYKLNGGAWQQASANDGNFDGVEESFTINLTGLISETTYTLTIKALDNWGNETAPPIEEVFSYPFSQSTGSVYLPLILKHY